MMRVLILLLFAGLGAAGAASAEACPAGAREAPCMLEAAWAAAEAVPATKQERLKPLFAPLALGLKDAKAKAVWEARLGETGIDVEGTDYVRRTAETAIREYGWEGFLQRARDGLAPLHMGRPEIMAAAIELAPDTKQRARIIAMMFDLAGAADRRVISGISVNAFERADFGHVLADRMMRDCKLADFDRATQLTTAPDALRYRLWRARITGGAGALADDIRVGDGSDDTSHVRQALEGYSAILSLGYCPQ
jgi:hypothetical protein